MKSQYEVFISVDVETAGPIPGEYSLLSIGACNVYDPSQTFICDLKPINSLAAPESLEVTGLSLDNLSRNGIAPSEAMERFKDWLSEIAGDNDKIVFVGFNAPFDWSFINYYFHKFSDGNPFGFTALDIKALYMGKTGCSWDDTKSSKIAEHLRQKTKGDHNALHDAQFQAELFRLIYGMQCS